MKLKFLILTMLAFAQISFAQSDWKTKNFDKWNAKDVETILNKSDWVKSQEVRLQYEGTNGSVAGASIGDGVTLASGITSANTGGVQPAIDFTFTMRLRSSLAIRLALIRKNQLETNVKKLSDKDRELFNKRQKGLYECPACAENYVVTLSSKSRENKNFDAVFTTFGNAQFNDIKRYIKLQNDKGEQRELVNFVPPKAPGDEAIFFFTRYDAKDNPLFTKESKYLIFNVTNNQVNTATNFKIEIAPLIVGGKVDF